MDVPQTAPTFSRWPDHFDHAVAVIGVEHIGLGVDVVKKASPVGCDPVFAPDPASVVRRKARLALEGFASPDDYRVLVSVS